LWFGNQFADDDENPTYGSAKVLAAYRDSGNWDCPEARSALKWLNTSQNDDGGWGGGLNVASSVEETALAVEILLSDDDSAEAAEQGLTWLIQRIEDGSFEETALAHPTSVRQFRPTLCKLTTISRFVARNGGAVPASLSLFPKL
jgi:squalene-hopene/tetraprenyl-beta-curcumene cyclase